MLATKTVRSVHRTGRRVRQALVLQRIILAVLVALAILGAAVAPAAAASGVITQHTVTPSWTCRPHGLTYDVAGYNYATGFVEVNNVWVQPNGAQETHTFPVGYVVAGRTWRVSGDSYYVGSGMSSGTYVVKSYVYLDGGIVSGTYVSTGAYLC